MWTVEIKSCFSTGAVKSVSIFFLRALPIFNSIDSPYCYYDKQIIKNTAKGDILRAGVPLPTERKIAK